MIHVEVIEVATDLFHLGAYVVNTFLKNSHIDTYG